MLQGPMQTTSPRTGRSFPQRRKATYVFGYKNVIGAKETTDALFNKVQLKNFMEAEIDTADKLDIEIEAYAIQADNIVNGQNKIDVSGELSVDTLNTIYDTFVNQNKEAGSAQ